jgi:hypothetical protein
MLKTNLFSQSLCDVVILLHLKRTLNVKSPLNVKIINSKCEIFVALVNVTLNLST